MISKIFEFNPNDTEQIRNLMDNSEKYGEMMLGENEKGEKVRISISKDNILVSTLQNNGWTRENYYYRNGTTEEIYSN